jgi:hypothetical protein
MKAKILISLAGLASFCVPTFANACSIPVSQRERAATPKENEQRALSKAASKAETRLHADAVVVGYLSDPIAMDYKIKKKTPVRVYEIVFPKKVLRGITKKTYSITVARTSCHVNPPRKQLIQLYLRKLENGWTVIAYDRLSK